MSFGNRVVQLQAETKNTLHLLREAERQQNSDAIRELCELLVEEKAELEQLLQESVQ